MTPGSLAALAVLFFATSIVTVVTGATSLITIPLLLWFGLAPRTAVATNMFALALLSLGGALPFRRTAAFDRTRLFPLELLTIIGSALGALLLFTVPPSWIALLVPIAMLAVLIVMIAEPAGVSEVAPSPARNLVGYAVMGVLAVYGGFISGGYATLLTAGGVLFFRYSLPRAIAMSKLLNVASSAIAVVVFASRGAVDWVAGTILGAAAFSGGVIGARWAQSAQPKFLRAVFLIAVALLAAKTLVFDVPWKELSS